MAEQEPNEFERLSAEEAGPGLLREFLEFLRYNKKWWLMPMLLVMLGMALLILLSNSAVAPFIYALF